MSPLRRWIVRWFVPHELQADRNTQRQAIRTIVFAMAMIAWAPIFAPAYLLLGSPRAGLMVALAGVAAVLVMFSMRFTKSVLVTGNLVAGAIYILLFALAWVTGGIDAPALWWFASVPIIGVLLCGIRSGFFWALVSCVTTFFFFALARLEVAIPDDIAPENLRLLDALSICGIVLCAFILTLTFKLSETAARRSLEAARDASDRANRAKSMLLANMSHEIRTPMNSIIGMTDLVLDTELTDEQREYLNIVQQSGESLIVLIDDILDFSVIEARRFELDCKPFDLRAALRHTMKSLGVRAHKRGLELICRIHADVPGVVIGDQVRLRQIIVNLIGNAIKFTQRGEVVFEVRRRSVTEDAVCLHFAVTDTGIGIPEDKRGIIFEVFEQAEMAKTRRFGGAGLGLAISSELVHMMQGEIGVESAVGHGTTFSFTANCALTPEDGDAPYRTQPPLARGQRVLVVDANATNRKVLLETCAEWGLDAREAATSDIALAMLRQSATDGDQFKVVLAGNNLAGVDGITLAQQVRDDASLDCAFVLMHSAGDHPHSEKEWESLGIDAHLLKPVTPTELCVAILAATNTADATDAGPPAPDPASIQRRLPLKILLVEDSLLNQKLAATILRKEGHSVVVANDGLEALDAVKSDRFDLILMDIQMPQMDGIEATRAIRARERETGERVPIIALTAHALKGDRERFLQAEMDGYIAKPIRARQLLSVIEEFLPGASNS